MALSHRPGGSGSKGPLRLQAAGRRDVHGEEAVDLDEGTLLHPLPRPAQWKCERTRLGPLSWQTVSGAARDDPPSADFPELYQVRPPHGGERRRAGVPYVLKRGKVLWI